MRGEVLERERRLELLRNGGERRLVGHNLLAHNGQKHLLLRSHVLQARSGSLWEHRESVGVRRNDRGRAENTGGAHIQQEAREVR